MVLKPFPLALSLPACTKLKALSSFTVLCAEYQRGPPMDPFQKFHVFPVLNAVLQMGLQGQSSGGKSPLCPVPPLPSPIDAAQGAVGPPGCEHPLLIRVQFFFYQDL